MYRVVDTCNRLLHCCVQVKTTSLLLMLYKKCYRSKERKKKKISIEVHIVVTFTRVYTKYHNCVTVLCNNIKYQWNKTRLLFHSTYAYIYIYYTAIENTLVSRVVLANKDFATKTKRALPVLRFFTQILLKICSNSDFDILLERKKKRER